MRAWMWLLGKEDQVDWENYRNYGAPILVQVGALTGFTDFPTTPDWTRMSTGRACTPDCYDGCDT